MTTAEFEAAARARRERDAAAGVPASLTALRDRLESMYFYGGHDADLLELLDAIVAEVERLSKP